MISSTTGWHVHMCTPLCGVCFCDLPVCVYYKLVSSFFLLSVNVCVCAYCLSGIYQWLVPMFGAQSFANTLCLEHCPAALVHRDSV